MDALIFINSLDGFKLLSNKCQTARSELWEIISIEGHICATFKIYQMEAFMLTDLQIMDSDMP